jgi:hypothetical protein
MSLELSASDMFANCQSQTMACACERLTLLLIDELHACTHACWRAWPQKQLAQQIKTGESHPVLVASTSRLRGCNDKYVAESFF